MEYVIYFNKEENRFDLFITDGIEEIDDDQIEFRKIYLRATLYKGGEYAPSLSGGEPLFVFMLDDEINEDDLAIFNNWNNKFNAIMQKVADRLTLNEKILGIKEIFEGNPNGNGG